MDKANIEMKKIFEWANQQEQLRVVELKEKGSWKEGLDGNEGAFDDIRAERDRRLYALADKYKIPYNKE